MSTVPEMIDAVKRLTEEDKGVFLEQLADVDLDDAWDRQIEADARAGKLDFLWEEAKREMAQGTLRPLDELLRGQFGGLGRDAHWLAFRSSARHAWAVVRTPRR